MNMNKKLLELERKGGLIRVGLIGAGQMGRGMISQIESMKGMRVVATADIRVEQAKNAYLFAGVRAEHIVQTRELEQAERAAASAAFEGGVCTPMGSVISPLMSMSGESRVSSSD